MASGCPSSWGKQRSRIGRNAPRCGVQEGTTGAGRRSGCCMTAAPVSADFLCAGPRPFAHLLPALCSCHLARHFRCTTRSVGQSPAIHATLATVQVTHAACARAAQPCELLSDARRAACHLAARDWAEAQPNSTRPQCCAAPALTNVRQLSVACKANPAAALLHVHGRGVALGGLLLCCRGLCCAEMMFGDRRQAQ